MGASYASHHGRAGWGEYDRGMQVSEAVRSLRAVRHYADRPLPEDVVVAILDAGRRAQSSMNEQPWQFVAVRDRETLQALSACGRYAGHVAGSALTVSLAHGGHDVDFDLGQAAAFMQLAALEAGVGSCVIAWWEPERVHGILGLPDGVETHLALAFGYPAEPPSPAKAGGRRPLADVVHWDRW
jgi:nitroreductase